MFFSNHFLRNFTEFVFRKKSLDEWKEDIILFMNMIDKQLYAALCDIRQLSDRGEAVTTAFNLLHRLT
jgi:hypothetical protein